MGTDSPLIVIVGQTASGKSAATVDAALRLDGEVISADSRTIYKSMDIGTAKPSAEEQASVPHHLLDVITPDQTFSAAQFKDMANKAIADIAARGKLPIMGGGTGLYVDAVLHDFTFRAPADPEQRRYLNSLSIETLQSMLAAQGIALPGNERNPRHLIRAIETEGRQAEHGPLRGSTMLVGLSIDREELDQRIADRVTLMIRNGLEAEAHELADLYGWDAPGMQSIGYREWREYFDGNQTLEQTQQSIVKSSKQYAKRQRTWFKRNNSIQWFSNREELIKFVVSNASKLNK